MYYTCVFVCVYVCVCVCVCMCVCVCVYVSMCVCMYVFFVCNICFTQMPLIHSYTLSPVIQSIALSMNMCSYICVKLMLQPHWWIHHQHLPALFASICLIVQTVRSHIHVKVTLISVCFLLQNIIPSEIPTATILVTAIDDCNGT